jgi:hypothetical protein
MSKTQDEKKSEILSTWIVSYNELWEKDKRRPATWMAFVRDHSKKDYKLKNMIICLRKNAIIDIYNVIRSTIYHLNSRDCSPRGNVDFKLAVGKLLKVNVQMCYISKISYFMLGYEQKIQCLMNICLCN